MATSEILSEIFNRLFAYYGPQYWWPGETPFEVMVGAVLTQNTSWQNVERAINTLKDVDLLSLEKMSALSPGLLAEYIRPAGYYNLKAARLQNLFKMVNGEYGGDLTALFAAPMEILREQLLAVKGIGPETADSILLYAARKPVFVVDAYTHRILSRHDVIMPESGYREIQELFMENLALDTDYFNEYHALLVRTAKEFCKKSNPRCSGCPLNGC